MIYCIQQTQRGKGFTLLEVLVAFSLLSILFAVIIQSQADTIFFLEKTNRMTIVQKQVMNELLIIERNLSAQKISSETGTFPEDHILHGSHWQKKVEVEDFLGITKVSKITYKIIWTEGNDNMERSFESSILGEVL